MQELIKWQRRTFWVCLIGYMGYYLCRQNLSAAFPLLSKAFSFSNSELGMIAFYSELSYAIGKFLNGPLADKIGGKKIFLIGMIGTILSNLLFSLGESLWFFIMSWCLCRYFLSMGWGGLIKMIGHWYEPERNGTIMGLISLNFQFGGVIATVFAGFLVSINLTWHFLFIYPALILFLIAIWSYYFSKESPSAIDPKTNFGKSTQQKMAIISQIKNDQNLKNKPMTIIKSLLNLTLFKQLLVFSFLTTFLRSIFFFWTPKFLVDLGSETSSAIFQSALFPLLGAIGTVLLGWYTDKFVHNGDRAKMMWIMLVGLFFTLSILGLSLNFQSKSLFFILIGLSGFFLLGPYSMSSGCLTLDIAGPNAAGSASGLIDGLGYIGGALAVWGAGKLSDLLGWQQVFYIMSFISLLSALIAYLMSRSFQSINLQKTL